MSSKEFHSSTESNKPKPPPDSLNETQLLTISRLFVGLSLKDGILKNALRQCATVTPGHYHYYVQHYSDSPPSEDEQYVTREANFSTYNLITLFLNDAEIASLGKLVSVGYKPDTDVLEDNEFSHLASDLSVPTVYHHYVVGAVGAGKSTVVSHLRDLVTHDEWVEDRLPELAEVFTSLDADAKQKDKKKHIDDWIAQQFREKNHILLDEKVGLIVSDRCPLDPLVFTDAKEWQEKAKFLLKHVCPGKDTSLVSGHIILLIDDPQVLDLRVRRTNKQYRANELQTMQESLQHLYSMEEMTCVDCRFRSLHDVMKEVGRIVHLTEKHSSADINKRMLDISGGEYGPPPGVNCNEEKK